MINYTEIPNPDDRLNSILDKISRFGIRNLKKEEIYFLDSYSIGKELIKNYPKKKVQIYLFQMMVILPLNWRI